MKSAIIYFFVDKANNFYEMPLEHHKTGKKQFGVYKFDIKESYPLITGSMLDGSIIFAKHMLL